VAEASEAVVEAAEDANDTAPVIEEINADAAETSES
jgi:hypothetical protein